MRTEGKIFELCLCFNCTSVFYNSPTHRISRVDPLQAIMDTCDCCRSVRGYDFKLHQSPAQRLTALTHTSCPPTQSPF